MQAGEIRLNKVTREWVIYAPSRRKRPQDFQKIDLEKQPVAKREAKCPFCPGNEHMSDGILLELPNREQTFWQTRIVPNKYPALAPDGNTHRSSHGIYLTMPGYGRHEVVVESPEHNKDIATMSKEEVEILIETYHKRYIDLMQEHQNMMAIIFRNHGDRAGASLKHPHSQNFCSYNKYTCN